MKNKRKVVSVYSTHVSEELGIRIEKAREKKGWTKSVWKRKASEELLKQLDLQDLADEYFERMLK
jgi:hypothetical protein